MKLPAAQFYFGDWRKDPSVQSLSYHDRGVWFEILCLMHESPERGKLVLNGNPMPEAALARILGLTHSEITQTITTLITYGVASYDERGALMSRRMVRDEEKLKKQREAGQLGGNPKFQKGKSNPYYQNQENQGLGLTEANPDLNKDKGDDNQTDNAEDNQQDNPEITPPDKRNITSSSSISSSSSTSVLNSFLAPKKQKGGVGKTDPPKEFIITDEFKAFADELGVNDVKLEVAKCLDHFRAIGERRKNWDATLRNWMRNHVKWEKERKNGATRPSFKTKPSVAERSAAAIANLEREWATANPSEFYEGHEGDSNLFS